MNPTPAWPSHTYVAGLSSRGTAHVQDPLVLLGCQGHDRQHTGSSLQHIVPSQVLRSSTCAGEPVSDAVPRAMAGGLLGSAHLPMGTEESYTTSPVFDHLPTGSRLTPRLINA